MKKIKIAVVTMVILIAIVVVFISFFVGKTIKVGVETVGPEITKTSVALESAKLSAFSGSGELKGLIVGNPEGFNTPAAIAMGHVKLDVGISSIFSDNIIVEEVLVDGVEITYEASLRGSNIKAIMDNVESVVGGTTGSQKDDPGDDDSGKEASSTSTEKRIQINNLVFRNGKIHISSKILQGEAMTIPLPTIERQDLAVGGVPASEMIAKLFRIIFKTVISAVTESGKLGGIEIPRSIDDISNTVKKRSAEIKDEAAEKLRSSTKEKASEAVDKLKGLFDR